MYGTPITAYQRDVIERLEALPGVLAASLAGVPPLPRWSRPVTPVRLPGDPVDPAQPYLVGTTLAGPRYFKTPGVGVVEGREFDDRDRIEVDSDVPIADAQSRGVSLDYHFAGPACHESGSDHRPAGRVTNGEEPSPSRCTGARLQPARSVQNLNVTPACAFTNTGSKRTGGRLSSSSSRMSKPFSASKRNSYSRK